MTRQRLVTPCCGAPILERPFQCMHEFEAWRTDGRVWPSCWIGHRPRQGQLALPLVTAA